MSIKKVQSNQSTILLAPSDYVHIFKGGEPQSPSKHRKTTIKKIQSEEPTALIAPSDYEHIFKGNEPSLSPSLSPTKKLTKKREIKKRHRIKTTIKKIQSDQPTALIAPSDYEHIFKGQDDHHHRDDIIKKIDSETPTALIAPSDFQHMYCDPILKKEITQRPTKKTNTITNNTSINNKKTESSEYELLPTFIINLIQKFITNQKRTYRIRVTTPNGTGTPPVKQQK